MHPGYVTEQVAMAAFGAALTVIFVAQLLERRPGQQVGKLKQTFHVLGSVASVCMLVRSIDPRGFHGILGMGSMAYQFLVSGSTPRGRGLTSAIGRFLCLSLQGNSTTSILLACTAAAVHYSLLSFTQGERFCRMQPHPACALLLVTVAVVLQGGENALTRAGGLVLKIATAATFVVGCKPLTRVDLQLGFSHLIVFAFLLQMRSSFCKLFMTAGGSALSI
jgi:hypothetical protein